MNQAKLLLQSLLYSWRLFEKISTLPDKELYNLIIEFRGEENWALVREKLILNKLRDLL